MSQCQPMDSIGLLFVLDHLHLPQNVAEQRKPKQNKQKAPISSRASKFSL